MDKSYKTYKRALNEYQKGNIEKAMKFCEKSISQNIKCAASINLKGLLYYLKGDIQNARALWKLNCNINKDSVSKKYLEDTKTEEKKNIIYYTAEKLIKELNINEALKLLEECKESDFNYINVNNSIAICYIKKGDYTKATEYVDKVLKLDSKNKNALQYRKELNTYGETKRKINWKIAAVFIVFLCVLGAAFSLNKIYPKVNTKNQVKTNKNKDNIQLTKSKPKEQITEPKKEQVIAKTPQGIFPYDDVKKAIDNKDFEKIYDYVIRWKDSSSKVDDKTLIAKGEEILRNEGNKFFYDNGLNFLKSKDFQKAQETLLKAYNYSEKSYLYQNIIYWLGVSFENGGKIEECFKYYTQYDNSFPNGSYEETVLYKLAMLNKDIDLQKAKGYAEKLSREFPQSFYNNSNMKGIITK